MNQKTDHDRTNQGETVAEKCPICDKLSNRYSIDGANLDFLRACAKQGNINEVISLSRIAWTSFPEIGRNINSQFLIDGISSNMLKALQAQINETLKPAVLLAEKFPELVYKLPMEIDKNISDRIGTFYSQLAKEFKETLSNMGFPEPEQMKILSYLLPVAVPLLQELLMRQKVPSEKGKAGELGLLDELKDYFPEDDYEHIGGPGDIDIVATPTYGDFSLTQKILIESKKNDSGWSSASVDNVRKHMQARSSQFAILVVEVMPRGARGFLIEHSDQGAVLITSRKDVCIVYGALRSVFIAAHPFGIRTTDLRKLLEEKRIEEAAKDAMHYQEYLRKIRIKATRIISNARSMIEIANDLDMHLRACLTELQKRIEGAVEEIAGIQPSAHAEGETFNQHVKRISLN